jgi:hypothetical protein
MDIVLNHLASMYYTQLALLLVTLTTVFIARKNRRKFRILKFFLLYALSSAIQILVTYACIVYFLHSALYVNSMSVYVFSIIELLVVYHFLFQVIISRRLKILMCGFMGIFFITISYMLYNEGLCLIAPTYVSIVNSLCIAAPCVFYFYEVFVTPPVNSLSDQPAFWISTGFLFLAICTLPFYLLENYIYTNMIGLYDQMFILNNVFYCMLFVLITKAFLCQAQIAK